MQSPKLERNQIFILASVLCAIFLAALDQTIVATALPQIVKDLNSFDSISWVFSSYMLASTVTIPIFGKLADIYGRRRFYLMGIVVFLAASVACGLAQSMSALIAFRALQGLGAGAIMVNSLAIIGDLFSPAERGKWQGVISSMFGLASIIGPLLGGWLSDFASWRYVFLVNIPFGLVVLLIIHYNFPHQPKEKQHHTIDYPGAVLLSLGLLSLLFSAVSVGERHRWHSPQVLFLLLLSFLLLAAFVRIELRAKAPIFPLELFSNRAFNVSIAVIFLNGMCMFGVISYIPIFAQITLTRSASDSGLILIPLILALTLSSVISGQIVSRTGKYKIVLIIGSLMTAIGMYLLAGMGSETTSLQLLQSMVLMGAGFGTGMPIFIVVTQSSFPHSKLGVVTSSTQLFRSIGSTLGIAFLGTLMTAKLSSAMATIDPSKFGLHDIDVAHFQKYFTPAFQQHGAPLLKLLRDDFTLSVSYVFSVCAVLSVVSLLLVFFLPEIPLRRRNEVSMPFLNKPITGLSDQS